MKNKKNWQDKIYRIDSHDRAKTLLGLFFALTFLTSLTPKSFADLLVQDAGQASSQAVPGVEAAEEAAPVIMVEKRAEGTVSGIDRNGIAVEYASDNESVKEIWINFSQERLDVRGVEGLSGIEVGDVVLVIYDETPDNKRYAKDISMVIKKAKAPEPAEEEVEE